MGRTIPIGHGGDMCVSCPGTLETPKLIAPLARYLRCLLFWSMWLPLGKVWSVDNVLRRKRRKSRSTTYYFSAATIGGMCLH